MSKQKIKIESHGISPWHYFLENMSWGFSRKDNDEDMMSFLNVDPCLKNGGRGLEDVLMADFLQSLDFADRSLLEAILKKIQGPSMKDAEIRGNAGNYYLPYEDEQKGIRLAQPDGWIADEQNLILLEAKGHRATASLNNGQLAKEYLIAKNVAEKTKRSNFYVLIIANELTNIYKHGNQNFALPENMNPKDSQTQALFKKLWDANVEDFQCAFKESLPEECKELKDMNSNEALPHFCWITWGTIKEIAREQNQDEFCRSEIIRMIDFHSKTSKEDLDNTTSDDSWPLFSKCLAELAAGKEPLFYFYNGGCGNSTLQKYEEEFLRRVGTEKTQQSGNSWQAWHNLCKNDSGIWKKLKRIVQRNRRAVAALRKSEQEIQNFYLSEMNIPGRKTTRKAIELLGEAAHILPETSFFEQRSIVDCKNLVRRFIEQYLSGDINKLKDYCFSHLEGIYPYGECNSGFDCDNTKLARAIYVLLWGGKGNIYEDMSMENLGTGRKYRGDTMNSFRSVLGRYENGQLCNELMKINPSDTLKEKIISFFSLYHTIGNFTVLPNISVDGDTLNMCRGTKFSDYFDRFLIEYDRAIKENDNGHFGQLAAKNRFPGSLKEMAEAMFWEDYFNREGNPQIVFCEHFCKRSMAKYGQNYLTHIENFLSVSSGIIERRTDKIIKRLNEIL